MALSKDNDTDPHDGALQAEIFCGLFDYVDRAVQYPGHRRFDVRQLREVSKSALSHGWIKAYCGIQIGTDLGISACDRAEDDKACYA